MMYYLLMSVGLTLSAAAAYFSITGLAAIFAGAFYSVVVMGSALEAAKLVIASWLYRRWKQINFLMKTYLITATVVLMLITSLGIFGYLSKAHIEQDIPGAQIQNQVVLLEQQIQQEQNNIDRSTKALNQMDAQIDAFVQRGSVSRSNSVRNQQKTERAEIKKSIDDSIEEIDRLSLELAPLKNQTALVEAKVGPLKYFAEMVQGEEVDLDKAVKMVILLLVFVFDPLAVIILIAANKEQMIRSSKNNDKKQEEKKEEKQQKSFENVEKSSKIDENIESFQVSDQVELQTEDLRSPQTLNADLSVKTEETPVESNTYDESKNRFTFIEEKTKIVESKIETLDDLIETEDDNENEYRFRHRKQRT